MVACANLDLYHPVDDAPPERPLNFLESPLDSFHEFCRSFNDWSSGKRNSLAERYAVAGNSLVFYLDVTIPGDRHSSGLPHNEKPVRDRVFRACIVFNANTANKLQFRVGDQEPMLVLDVDLAPAKRIP